MSFLHENYWFQHNLQTQNGVISGGFLVMITGWMDSRDTRELENMGKIA